MDIGCSVKFSCQGKWNNVKKRQFGVSYLLIVVYFGLSGKPFRLFQGCCRIARRPCHRHARPGVGGDCLGMADQYVRASGVHPDARMLYVRIYASPDRVYCRLSPIFIKSALSSRIPLAGVGLNWIVNSPSSVSQVRVRIPSGSIHCGSFVGLPFSVP